MHLMLDLPPLAFSRPDFLSLFALVPLFWLWQWRAFRSFSSFFRLLLHSLVLSLLILAAAGLHRLMPGTANSPLLVLDLSHSLTPAQRHWMQNTIEQRLHPVPETPTVVFAGSARRLSWRETKALLSTPPSDLQLEQTNLEAALADLLRETAGRNVYLLSD